MVVNVCAGFQTHTTPVLLAHGERAELATEEYIPLTPIMEGFVMLRKNPDYWAILVSLLRILPLCFNCCSDRSGRI